jgi:hypothetical protein
MVSTSYGRGIAEEEEEREERQERGAGVARVGAPVVGHRRFVGGVLPASPLDGVSVLVTGATSGSVLEFARSSSPSFIFRGSFLALTDGLDRFRRSLEINLWI